MILAVAVLAAVVVTTTLLENDDLLALRLCDDFGGDGQLGCVLHVAAFTGEQDVIQGHLVTSLTGQLLDDDLVSGGDAILLAARAHDCEHGSSLLVQICFTQIDEDMKPLTDPRGNVARYWNDSLLSTTNTCSPGWFLAMSVPILPAEGIVARMTPAPTRMEAGQGRLLFILFLWLSLSVAILSALAPLGPPSSRLTGSAFNPATTSVVLKARADANPVFVRAAEPDGDGPASLLIPAAIWPLPATLLLALWLFRPIGRFFPSFLFSTSFHLLSRPRVRGPPIFF